MRFWVYAEKRVSTTVVIDAADLSTALTRLPADPPDVDDSELWVPVAVTDQDGNDVPLPDNVERQEGEDMPAKDIGGKKPTFKTPQARQAPLRAYRDRVSKAAAVEQAARENK